MIDDKLRFLQVMQLENSWGYLRVWPLILVPQTRSSITRKKLA